MQYVRFGKTGMKVSPLCLGCMTYGDKKWREWVLGEEEGRTHIKAALEAGINFFDTADVYSRGVSEQIVGKALRRFRQARRGGDRHQGAWRDGSETEPARALAQAHHGGDRRLAEAARHGLRRPLHHPPLRLRHADRGDDPGALRCGEGRQSALSRRVKHVVVAVREDADAAARAFSCAVRVDAELLQPGLSRGGARDAAALQGGGDRGDPLVADRARLSRRLDAEPGREDAARPDRQFRDNCSGSAPPTPITRSPSACGRWPRSSACRGRRWRSPGCWPIPR